MKEGGREGRIERKDGGEKGKENERVVQGSTYFEFHQDNWFVETR